MKKIPASVFIIIAFGFYAFFYNRSQPSSSVPVVSSTDSSGFESSTSQVTVDPTPTIGDAGAESPGQFKNGTYTGTVEDAFYGNIQVQAIIEGGRLTDVKFLQYPNDRAESIEINTVAIPVLRQEAIESQSAVVDIATRATDSTHAFTRSLSAALEQAES